MDELPYIPITAIARDVWPRVRGRVRVGPRTYGGAVRLLEDGERVRVGDTTPRVYPWGTEVCVSPAVDPHEVELLLTTGWSAVVAELIRQLRPGQQTWDAPLRLDHGAWAILGRLVEPLVFCTDPERADVVVDGVEHVTERDQALVMIWTACVRAGRVRPAGRVETSCTP